MTVTSAYNDAMRAHNGHVTAEDAGRLVTEARRENAEAGSAWCCSSTDGTDGTQHLNRIYTSHGDSFEPAAGRLVENFLRGGRPELIPVNVPHGNNRPDHPSSIDRIGKELIKTTANHRTWECNWFPMKDYGSARNNLYAPGGACAKYDAAFGAGSQTLERGSNYRAANAGGDAQWAGHCDMAARVSCLLRQPVRSVEHGGQTFTPNDIQGLLVMCSNDIADREDFWGARYNGTGTDDRNEPYPHTFLPKLIEVAKSGVPYVLDIDPAAAVWNYPFDSTEIRELKTPPDGLPTQPARSGGEVRYQVWNLSGKGYANPADSNNEIRYYRSWIEYDRSNKPVASGWYPAAGRQSDRKANPDFAWVPKPRGDLSNAAIWAGTSSYNSQIDLAKVFEIYRQSI